MMFRGDQLTTFTD